MGHQSEATLENQLIKQLQGLDYAAANITDGAALVRNLKNQLEAFNQTDFTDKEFDAILNHLAKGNVFEKAKTLRDRFHLSKEDGTSFYVRFFNSEDWQKNLYQVTNQVTQEGSYKNRYDVTLLVNGLPLVQIELKRTGLDMKKAFDQINRYQRHSFDANYGLFRYVQIFVISNGVDTKYFSNNKKQSYKQSIFWADSKNKRIKSLTDFAVAFLSPNHLGKMISKYIVSNETHKVMMVLRPYQYYATEAIILQVTNTTDNGYIWHTTGSGKTLTSFKTSQILMELPQVYKIVFVVDRKDLDYQTQKEFNSFKKDSVSKTGDTSTLLKQLADDTKLVLTTIQKLNNAVSDRYKSQIDHLKNKRIVFIFDECHRSQFGKTHDSIIKFFAKSQIIGFTGTPIFAAGATKNDLGTRTTKDLFGNCLHKYVITDAIRDQKVLRFGIEYVGKYKKNTSKRFIDIDVEEIDKAKVFNDSLRLEKIADYIIAHHNQKTFSKEYSALFAVSSVKHLIKYYDIFQRKKLAGEHDLRIAAIFTYRTNEQDKDANDSYPDDYDNNEDIDVAAEPKALYGKSSHTRDKLETYIADYNQMYGTKCSTKDSELFDSYSTGISKRLKEREKNDYEKERLDIVIVVNMMLTGFDAKKVNTLYVDKNLKQHGLIQAFSRTNRIFGEEKSQGNILCFRNLKKATDDAITLFSNKDAIEVVTLPEFEDIVKKIDEAVVDLRSIAPTYQSVDDFPSETEEYQFVIAFRRVMRALNILQSYVDFDWNKMLIDEQEYHNYRGKYLTLNDKVKKENKKQKVSILEDIDFELELIHRDRVNVAYIIKLIAKLKASTPSEAQAQKKAIIDLLGGDLMLRSKRELIEKFIEENLPKIDDADKIDDAFEQYWQDQKVLALDKLCKDEELDKAQFKSLIDAYIYSGQEPIKDEVLKCLDNRPSVLQARSIGQRIVAKMREFVEVFVLGMVG